MRESERKKESGKERERESEKEIEVFSLPVLLLFDVEQDPLKVYCLSSH
jgi:hypothetical protein